MMRAAAKRMERPDRCAGHCSLISEFGIPKWRHPILYRLCEFSKRDFGMRVVPVLDLLNGTVVRAVAGQRAAYRPVVSRLVESSDPLDVARAFRNRLGLDTIYVADLDAILHNRPNDAVYRRLLDDGFSLWLDAGLRSVADAQRLLALGISAAVLGLETWPGPAALAELCHAVDPERLIFSLDLRAGRPLGERGPWQTDESLKIAAQVLAAGITRLIVLDLAQVGVEGGLTTLELCTRIRERASTVQLITGGGVRHADDLAAVRGAGVTAVLVASALHDGRLNRADLARYPGNTQGNAVRIPGGCGGGEDSEMQDG